jgi:hypothetical protein
MRVTVLQERDIVARWTIYAGVAALIFLLVIGAAATWVVGDRLRPAPTAPARTMVPREVNLIDQTLFAAHQSSTGRWAETRRSLNDYRWIDKEHGVAQIPIERAMAIIASQEHVR